MVVRSVGRSVITESTRVISALPAAKALSTARHIVASQTVLIMLCPEPVAENNLRIDSGRLKGRLVLDDDESH
jgi:hypothetical protein